MYFEDCRNNSDRDKYGLCAAGLGKCEPDCVFYMKVNKPTNADRIRGMSDEELAGIIAIDFTDDKIGYCQNKPECDDLLDGGGIIPDDWCVQCALNWLRQPE